MREDNLTSDQLQRYSVIDTILPREFLLLQGEGCRWRKCTFCNYHNDTSADPYLVNREVLDRVTGLYGVVDIINSGSAMELDSQTIAHIQRVVREKNIHTIWFEAHWIYRNRLQQFAELFAPARVKFRCGVESFDPLLRNSWNKGIPADVTPEDVAHYFDGVSLLCCTVGDTRERITNDIALARRHFEYFSINLFCNNGTEVKRDEELAAWFENDIDPTLAGGPGVEVLLNNTDLGVG